jgi:hypothetical protein
MIKLLFSCAAILTLIGCSTPEVEEEVNNVTDNTPDTEDVMGDPNKKLFFTQAYEGKIGNDLEIVMELKVKDGLATGKYFYTSSGEDMSLEGTCVGDSVFLSEYNAKGVKTGSLEGEVYGENNYLKGTWSNAKKTKKLSLLCEYPSDGYDNLQAAILEKLNPITYYIEDGKYENDLGDIKIDAFSDTSFYFEMLIATQECIGDISGIAQLKGGKKAEFHSKDCESLIFKFYEGRVEVSEAGDCSEFHGMKCTFNQVFSL